MHFILGIIKEMIDVHQPTQSANYITATSSKRSSSCFLLFLSLVRTFKLNIFLRSHMRNVLYSIIQKQKNCLVGNWDCELGILGCLDSKFEMLKNIYVGMYKLSLYIMKILYLAF